MKQGSASASATAAPGPAWAGSAPSAPVPVTHREAETSRAGFLRKLGLATAATAAASAVLAVRPDEARAESTVSGSLFVNDTDSGLPVALLGNIAPSGHRAGALIFFGDNGSGTGGSAKMAWSTGVDTAAATPYRDFFIAKVVGEAVNDVVALYHNGDAPPTIGLGWISGNPNARVSISAEDSDPTMSALSIRHSTTMTSGNPFEIVDSATGRRRTWYDSGGCWNGMTIRSASGGYPHVNLAMVDQNGGTAYQWRHESDGSLSLFYATGGGKIVEYTGGSSTRFLTPQMGFFGAAPVTRPTVTGSRGGNPALGALITSLANLGLISDKTTS